MDATVVGQVAMVVLGALEVLAIVAAALPERPHETAAGRLRRRARWVTVAAVVPVVWLLWALVIALNPAEGTRDRAGALLVLVLGGVVALGVLVTRAAWRAVAQAGRHDEARAIGLTRLVDDDTAAGPHEGLSGRTPPPRRW
jgi:hypothetical protein